MTDNYKILGHMRDLVLRVYHEDKESVKGLEAKLEIMVGEMDRKREQGWLTKGQRDQLADIVRVYEEYKTLEKKNG